MRLFIYKDWKLNITDIFNYNKIIIIIFFIQLLINIMYLTKKNTNSLKNFETVINYKMKRLDNKIGMIKNNILIINNIFKASFSFLNNIKNESSIYNLLRPKDIKGKKKVRIGKKGDGGYILLNDFENIKIAYSFGISNDTSFDKDLADKNIDVFMYDHTINNLSFTIDKFHWKQIGITDKKGQNNNMKTLNELLKENGHFFEKNMILKIDIEGEEWNIFHNLGKDTLTQFKYILVEFHFDKKFESLFIKVLKKLNETHQIFHLHCNNCCSFINFDGHIICYALEISYILRGNNTFIKSSDYYPIKNMDYQNVKKNLDIDHFLNIYQFDNIFPIK